MLGLLDAELVYARMHIQVVCSTKRYKTAVDASRHGSHVTHEEHPLWGLGAQAGRPV